MILILYSSYLHDIFEFHAISSNIEFIDSNFQIRQCESPLCEGAEGSSIDNSKQSRPCNTQPCQENSGGWSCWTDWSECSVSCGVGVRWRSRKCLSSYDDDDCEGPSTARETCEMPSCESLRGWDQWSSWSSCNHEGQQFRKRVCLKEPCASDRTRESRICSSEWTDNGESSDFCFFFYRFKVAIDAFLG